jgi:hypothetical protein
MIDDATSKVVARFYPAETTEGYMDLLRRYLRKHGRMVAMYTDNDSVFVNWDAKGDRVGTQFSRALEELDIGWIPAGSPQAKGRVERFNGTAQDRLVKELRLAGAATMERANEVLDAIFIPWFNRHCTVRPVSGNNAHRPLHPSMNLSAILSIQEKRRVANDYTIRLDNQVYQLLKPALPGERRGWVIVEKRLDGSMQIRFKQTYLAYHQIGPADRAGLCPAPRSLSLGRTPAGGNKKEGQAYATARPSAVRPAPGRSGRTPAEPCPPKGKQSLPHSPTPRPRPGQAWMRNFRLRGSPPKKADILILAK